MVYVTLLIPSTRNADFAHTQLDLDGSHRMADLLSGDGLLKVSDVYADEGFTSYLARSVICPRCRHSVGDEMDFVGWGPLEDSQGGVTTMGALLRHSAHPLVVENPRNRAAWAYLAVYSDEPARRVVVVFT